MSTSKTSSYSYRSIDDNPLASLLRNNTYVHVVNDFYIVIDSSDLYLGTLINLFKVVNGELDFCRQKLVLGAVSHSAVDQVTKETMAVVYREIE